MTTARPWVLETERLGLRELVPDDSEAVAGIFADPYARRFFPDHDNVRMAGRWVERNAARYRKDGHGLWAMVLKETGDLIGDVGPIWQDDVDGRRELEVAYHLAQRWRGRGYASEGALACLRYAIRNIPCTRVVSMVHPDNEASYRVASRIHAHVERFMRHGSRYYLFFTPAGPTSAEAGP